MFQLRKLFPLTLLFLVLSCVKDDDKEKVIACIPSGLGNNVIAFYPFSGGSLKDIAGNENHLANFDATPTTDRKGNPNCAYEFDNLPGSKEFLTTPNTSFLNNLKQFSISLWYQPVDTNRDGGDFETLICRDQGGSCPDRKGQWSVGLYDCRKAVFGRTNSVWDLNINKGNNFSCQKEIVDRTGAWHHLVATYNQNGTEMKIYRDGILQDFAAGGANCGSGTVSSKDIGDLFLGVDYKGKIDDVILFDKTLSQQEVNTLYSIEPCCE